MQHAHHVSAACIVQGFDFGKIVYDVTKKAEGASGAAAGLPLAIGMQGAQCRQYARSKSMVDRTYSCFSKVLAWVWAWSSPLFLPWSMSSLHSFHHLCGTTCLCHVRQWSQVWNNHLANMLTAQQVLPIACAPRTQLLRCCSLSHHYG